MSSSDEYEKEEKRLVLVLPWPLIYLQTISEINIRFSGEYYVKLTEGKSYKSFGSLSHGIDFGAVEVKLLYTRAFNNQ